MNVLVVDHEEVAELLGAGGAGVERLAGPDHALARIAAEPETVALVLARARDRPCLERRLCEGVAAAGSDAPVLFLRDAAPRATGPPPMCAVEERDDGTRLLRCALQQARADPAGQPELAEAVGDRSLVFAYSAPVRRRG